MLALGDGRGLVPVGMRMGVEDEDGSVIVGRIGRVVTRLLLGREGADDRSRPG